MNQKTETIITKDINESTQNKNSEIEKEKNKAET